MRYNAYVLACTHAPVVKAVRRAYSMQAGWWHHYQAGRQAGSQPGRQAARSSSTQIHGMPLSPTRGCGSAIFHRSNGARCHTKSEFLGL